VSAHGGATRPHHRAAGTAAAAHDRAKAQLAVLESADTTSRACTRRPPAPENAPAAVAVRTNGVIEIAAIRLAGGQHHEHITEVLWRSGATAIGLCTREAIVAWLQESSSHHATVANGSTSVEVAVVRATNQPPYIRTCTDGALTDTLLSLPRI
jgi:hypothetical protein